MHLVAELLFHSVDGLLPMRFILLILSECVSDIIEFFSYSLIFAKMSVFLWSEDSKSRYLMAAKFGVALGFTVCEQIKDSRDGIDLVFINNFDFTQEQNKKKMSGGTNWQMMKKKQE